MNEKEFLAARFEEHRPHLRAVSYRILGSISDADAGASAMSSREVRGAEGVAGQALLFSRLAGPEAERLARLDLADLD